jgi:hypothetical protein
MATKQKTVVAVTVPDANTAYKLKVIASVPLQDRNIAPSRVIWFW